MGTKANLRVDNEDIRNLLPFRIICKEKSEGLGHRLELGRATVKALGKLFRWCDVLYLQRWELCRFSCDTMETKVRLWRQRLLTVMKFGFGEDSHGYHREPRKQMDHQTNQSRVLTWAWHTWPELNHHLSICKDLAFWEGSDVGRKKKRMATARWMDSGTVATSEKLEDLKDQIRETSLWN